MHSIHTYIHTYIHAYDAGSWCDGGCSNTVSKLVRLSMRQLPARSPHMRTEKDGWEIDGYIAHDRLRTDPSTNRPRGARRACTQVPVCDLRRGGGPSAGAARMAGRQWVR